MLKERLLVIAKLPDQVPVPFIIKVVVPASVPPKVKLPEILQLNTPFSVVLLVTVKLVVEKFEVKVLVADAVVNDKVPPHKPPVPEVKDTVPVAIKALTPLTLTVVVPKVIVPDAPEPTVIALVMVIVLVYPVKSILLQTDATLTVQLGLVALNVAVFPSLAVGTRSKLQLPAVP